MRRFLGIAGVIFCILPTVSSAEENLFPVPPNLRDNVAFWKRIYSEVSLEEGLLHDSEYPAVVYGKLRVGKIRGNTRTASIRKERERVEAILRTLESNADPENLSAEEKRVYDLFNKTVGLKSISGAINRIRFQQGQNERFLEGIYRSGAYLDTIRAVLREYDVPLLLAYLPHVESSFNPHAYSKVGAAGLWQFMRGTGKQYLKIDYTIDERRDPIASTYAAAKLLSHNYRELKAWPLAITAYNHGLYGMKRAVANTGSRDIGVIVEKHSSRSFKFASKNFYSCFLAAIELADSAHILFPDQEYAPRLVYNDIKLPYYATPQTICTFLGLDEETFSRLNLAIRPAVYQQQSLIPKGTVLHVPEFLTLASAQEAFGKVPDSLKFETPPRPQYYRVRPGDNLYAISRKFGVSAAGLALANEITRMNRIYAGQVLRLPGTAQPEEETVVAAVVDEETVVAAVVEKEIPEKAEIVAASISAVPAKTTVARANEKPDLAGAIIKSAAQTAKPEPEDLPDSLKQIVMAEADTTQLGAAVSSRFDADDYDLEIAVSPTGNTALIRVGVNETLGHYADWMRLPTYILRRLNGMGRGSDIHIGRLLKIPSDPQKVDEFKRRRLEYHMSLEEDFYTQYKVVEVQAHEIKRGENVWDLCNDPSGQIPLWLLIKYNRNIQVSRLMAGQRVWIPSVSEKTEEDLTRETSDWAGIYPAYHEPTRYPSTSVVPVP